MRNAAARERALQGPREVTVCFDSHLYRGNRIRKVSVAEYDAFESPNFPVLGVLGVEAKFQRGLQRHGKSRLMAKLDPRVFLLKIFPGLDPALPLSLLPKVKGLVIEAHGSGNFPFSAVLGRSLLPLFKEARRSGVPVVVVSQAHRNGIDLKLYESGRAALGEGAISGGDLTPSAAVVKLMHALAWHRTPLAVKTYIERSVVGERT